MSKDSERIISLFSALNNSGIQYVLLRNINNELPEHYRFGEKDIDLLIRPADRGCFHTFMKEHRFIQYPHPLDKGKGIVYLYAVYPFEFYKKDGLILDVCYQMVCKSPNGGEYMPVDILINDSVWMNRVVNDKGWYQLCKEDQLVHLLTRCIFDKGSFPDAYKKEISELYKSGNKMEIQRRFDVVFFKFSKKLIELLETNNYEQIIHSYFTYTSY